MGPRWSLAGLTSISVLVDPACSVGSKRCITADFWLSPFWSNGCAIASHRVFQSASSSKLIYSPTEQWMVVLQCTCRPTSPESLTCHLDRDSDHPDSTNWLAVPSYNLAAVVRRAFPVSAANLWNSLPAHLTLFTCRFSGSVLRPFSSGATIPSLHCGLDLAVIKMLLMMMVIIILISRDVIMTKCDIDNRLCDTAAFHFKLSLKMRICYRTLCRLSVCNVGRLWSHTLRWSGSNFTDTVISSILGIEASVLQTVVYGYPDSWPWSVCSTDRFRRCLRQAIRCLPDSPKPDSPKLGFRVRVRVRVSVSANRDWTSCTLHEWDYRWLTHCRLFVGDKNRSWVHSSAHYILPTTWYKNVGDPRTRSMLGLGWGCKRHCRHRDASWSQDCISIDNMRR